MNTMILAAIIAISFSLWRIGRRVKFFLHLFQLEGYAVSGFRHWLTAHIRDAVLRNSHLLGFVLLAVLYFFRESLPASLQPLFLLLWAATFASSRRYRRDRPKKPLVMTPRARRLLALTIVLLAVFPVSGTILSGFLVSGFSVSGTSLPPGSSSWTYVVGVLSGLYAADLLTPFVLLVSAFVIRPVERRIQSGFKSSARQKLQDRAGNLEIIAITGSYGKTSVKFAVRQVLGHRYPVLATPGSFNTPMGICRVINDDLRASHRILILEMGIRNPGDIDELTAVAVPDIALITSIGVAHLETMRSVDAIAREKSRLLHAVRPGGQAILNGDDERVRAMAGGFPGKVWLVSTDTATEADIYADRIGYDAAGARFDVIDEIGNRVAFQTRLVGRHNISNILMAIAVGRIHGLRLRQMRRSIATLAPIPHRLEVRQEGDVTIIDDAFNSNPTGARNAVEILGSFDTGRRVIVTPGMIELGELETAENRKLGVYMADHVDLALLVGPARTAPIADGLRAGGFPEEQIRTVRSLFEARTFLANWLQKGDTVLFENDLPDQFNEKPGP